MKKTKYYLCLEKTADGIGVACNVKNSKPKNGLSFKLSYKDAADIMFLIASQTEMKEVTDNASN